MGDRRGRHQTHGIVLPITIEDGSPAYEPVQTNSDVEDGPPQSSLHPTFENDPCRRSPVSVGWKGRPHPGIQRASTGRIASPFVNRTPHETGRPDVNVPRRVRRRHERRSVPRPDIRSAASPVVPGQICTALRAFLVGDRHLEVTLRTVRPITGGIAHSARCRRTGIAVARGTVFAIRVPPARNERHRAKYSSTRTRLDMRSERSGGADRNWMCERLTANARVHRVRPPEPAAISVSTPRPIRGPNRTPIPGDDSVERTRHPDSVRVRDGPRGVFPRNDAAVGGVRYAATISSGAGRTVSAYSVSVSPWSWASSMLSAMSSKTSRSAFSR